MGAVSASSPLPLRCVSTGWLAGSCAWLPIGGRCAASAGRVALAEGVCPSAGLSEEAGGSFHLDGGMGGLLKLWELLSLAEQDGCKANTEFLSN